jgi:sterol desaturase/sphingolipid hydroxylase (fatty acid hydroxylase superfamily)
MLDYLEANENSFLFAAVVGTFILSVLWEAVSPRRLVNEHSIARWRHNITLSLVNQVVVYWLSVVATLAVAWWAARTGTGLLTKFDIGFGVALLITALTFELLAYLLHRLLHRVRWLWRIHSVHHSDTELDFTTTYRNHPLEVILVALATAPVTALLAPPVAVVVAYQMTRASVNILAHSNIYLPESLDRWLRCLIVTPDFHRCHHSDDQRFTNSNYGAFLPLFDYLFGTATRKPFAEHPAMSLGLEYFRDPRDSRFDKLLLMPFRRTPPETARPDTLAHSAV